MVRLAVARNPRFAVSTVEMTAPDCLIPSTRSVNLPASSPSAIRFISSSAWTRFVEIGTWKDFTEIFPLCNFIVTSRPGSKENDPLKGTGVAVKKLFCYDSKKNYRHQSGTRVYFIELTDIAISASEIRALVRKASRSVICCRH